MTFAMAHPWITFSMFVFGCITIHDCICAIMNGKIYRERAKRSAETQSVSEGQ